MSTVTDLPLSTPYPGGYLLLCGLSADGRAEVYKFVDLAQGRLHEMRIRIDDRRARQLEFLRQHLTGELPYGLARHEEMLPYMLHPHSFLETSSGQIVVGFKQAPYMRTLHAGDGHPTWPHGAAADPARTLSSTNCEIEPDAIACTSTDTAARLRRYRDPSQALPTDLLIHDRRDGVTEQRGPLPDFITDTLHQLTYSPAGFFVGVDMNLSVQEGPAGLIAGASPQGVDAPAYAANPFPRSGFFVADDHLKEVTVHTPLAACAAHADVDLLDPEVFYVSCNNISKWRSQVVVHGPGQLDRYRYQDGTLALEASYSDPEFLRITSQRCFLRAGRQLVAVTGYPDQLYLLDALTLTLVDRITLFADEHREPPFACQKNSRSPLYLAVSEDGRHVYLTGAAELFIVDLDERRVVDQVQFCEPGSFAATAHIGLVSPAAAGRALGWEGPRR
jgi:hypothetical protein